MTPINSSTDKIRVVFNDCLRLLTNKRRRDHAKIEDMLKELEWLSINQLCAEIRLLEAWKSVQPEDYCMKDTLQKKEKSRHMGTRSDNQTLLVTGDKDKFTNGSFVHLTAKVWNSAPINVKESVNLSEARRAIRKFVRTLPI